MELPADQIIGWAHDHAQELLEPLGRRWLHAEAAAQIAREIARSLDAPDGHALVAAAYVHDIGYTPSLATTGFHPLDGGRHLHHLGHPRLAGLVAHHTGARHEAATRRLHHELATFDDEASIVTVALTYCDLTSGPDGETMTLQQRRRDIEQRYGPDSPVVASLDTFWPELIAGAARIEQLGPQGLQRQRL